MKPFLGMIPAIALTLLAPTIVAPASAQTRCTNLATTCSSAKQVCFGNMKKAGLDQNDCHGWFNTCMKTGRWDTNTCRRGGLKRI